MSNYIIVFDRRASDYKIFHEQLTGHPRISNWWHYIKSMYIVKTDLTVQELSAHVRKSFAAQGIDDTHVVLKVDLSSRQGMLTKEAWEWIRKNA